MDSATDAVAVTMDMDEPGVALALDLDAMTVADYAALLVALVDDDHIAVVDILDRYAVGGLKERHWLNYFIAIDMADQHIEAGRKALREAQAAASFANTVGAPTWAARE